MDQRSRVFTADRVPGIHMMNPRDGVKTITGVRVWRGQAFSCTESLRNVLIPVGQVAVGPG